MTCRLALYAYLCDDILYVYKNVHKIFLIVGSAYVITLYLLRINNFVCGFFKNIRQNST